MAVSITISADLSRLLAALGGTARRARNMRPAWNAIGDLMLESVAENFRSGGRPPWPPLKDASIAKGRRRRRVRGKILDASGALARSIEKHLVNDGVEIGSDLDYAAAHQFGTDDIPARPFLVVQSEDERAMVQVIERYLVEPLR